MLRGLGEEVVGYCEADAWAMSAKQYSTRVLLM